jgi:alpha-L-rhamnosidase
MPRSNCLHAVVWRLLLAAVGAAVPLSASPPSAVAQTALAPAGLTVDLQRRPLAVESASPLLGWVVRSSGAGQVQSAYQVQVATSPALLAAGAPDQWDSGKVVSQSSANVAYGGPALLPSQRYWWSVRTWDAAGNASPWAAAASFGAALKADWRGSPIWAAGRSFAAWTNYRIETDFTIKTVAAGVFFRASSTSNAYMWQVRATDNALRLHYVLNGQYTNFKSVALPMTIGTGVRHRLAIEASGATLTTSIDGVVVDTTSDTRFSGGAVGFRHGGTESATYDNLRVTSSAGQVLYENSFDQPGADFACGQVASGALSVGAGAACLLSGGDDWAFMRRVFTVQDKPIAWATLYATGRSTEPARQYVYRLSLNGSFVGVGPARARSAGATMYGAYDVTALLRRGAPNALGALAYTTSDKRFLAQLVIAYADGTRDVLVTDSGWRTLAGPSALPAGGSVGTQYYVAPAENIDARAYPLGFDQPGFAETDWLAASVKAAIGGLLGTPAPPVEQRLLAPAAIVQVAAGRYFLDFGRTVVGGLQLKLSGAGGETVEIRLGEELSAANTVRYQLRTGNTYRDVWTLRAGAQTLQHWGYRVFRYAEVIGAPQALAADNVAAAALVYPYDQDASAFSSSNAALDQVHAFSRDGVRALNLDLHLDSPTRERAPYEGDNLIHMLIQGASDGDYAQSRSTMEWLIDNPTWPSEWKLASILSAWEYWRATGDTSSAAASYDKLAAFLPVGYIGSDGLVNKPATGSAIGDDLVDWPAAERDGYVFTTVNTVINAWSYRAFADMADMAAALGKSADATRYRDIATKMRDAINTKLFDTAAGAYRDGLSTTHISVHASVFALAFGVAGPGQIGRAADYVAGRGIVCSVFCANFLIQGLYNAGRGADAVRLMTSTGTRSWRHMIALGAGSPMEAWDPSLKSNLTFSHPWSGSPAYLVYRGALGIQPLEAGFGRFEVRPQPGGLTAAQGVMPTVRGPVRAAFAVTGDRIDLALGAPANTSARVVLPAPADGGAAVFVDRVAVQGVRDGTTLTVDVGSGCHIISTRGADSPPANVAQAASECAGKQ